MKYPFALSILISVFVLLLGCAPKIQVRNINDLGEKDAVTGVFYALPQTVVTIDITVSRTDNIRGPYYAYAGKYLGLENVFAANSTSYEISSIQIGSYVEPDPAHFYMITPPKNALKKRRLLINLSESGLIKSINEKTEGLDVGNLNYSFTENESGISSETFNYHVEGNIFERVDTIIEMIHLDTITIERHTLRTSFVEKDSEQRAKEVAEYILKIKEKKFELLSGFAEIPYDRGTLAYMFEQLDSLETQYLSLFTGNTLSRSNTYRFVFLPRKEEVGLPVHLFNFSKREGVLDPFSNRGDEFFLVIRNKTTTNPLSALVNERRSKKSGVFYRIPEYGTVTLISKNKTEAEASFLINQFGVVHHLDPSNLQLQFYPNSGAIKSIGIER